MLSPLYVPALGICTNFRHFKQVVRALLSTELGLASLSGTPPKLNLGGATQAFAASAPEVNASSALNAQAEPCQTHDQPGDETNREAHSVGFVGLH